MKIKSTAKLKEKTANACSFCFYQSNICYFSI